MTPSADSVLAETFTREWGRVVAALIGATGDWDLAEECAQEAFALALPAWRRDGIPDHPRAWLITAARNRAVDHLRRARRGEAKLRELAVPVGQPEPDPDALASGIGDDRLRLIFTCCHPALALDDRVALALRTLCGLSTAEIARTFLIGEAAMAKRLTRTKQKITLAGIPYRVPPAHLLPERTTGVLAVLYLMFHEGYAATSGPALIREDLCAQAVELAGLLPPEPESLGLSALLQLLHARRNARVSADGALVPLDEQDRSRWDADGIIGGVATIRRALRGERVGPYQLQALIAATHATTSPTDWGRIAGLYDRLVVLVPSTTVALNRAIAVAMSAGPDAGLTLLDQVQDHPLLPAARADLLRRLGRLAAAVPHYLAALPRTTNEAERLYLVRRLRECGHFDVDL
jgi:RNA polymerase sigma-70 factor (ECF subfamily)